MKFEFNPESDIEAEMIDRCIFGRYIVDIYTEDGDLGTPYVIIGRLGGMETLLVLPVTTDEFDSITSSRPAEQIASDSILHIYVN